MVAVLASVPPPPSSHHLLCHSLILLVRFNILKGFNLPGQDSEEDVWENLSQNFLETNKLYE